MDVDKLVYDHPERGKFRVHRSGCCRLKSTSWSGAAFSTGAGSTLDTSRRCRNLATTRGEWWPGARCSSHVTGIANWSCSTTHALIGAPSSAEPTAATPRCSSVSTMPGPSTCRARWSACRTSTDTVPVSTAPKWGCVRRDSTATGASCSSASTTKPSPFVTIWPGPPNTSIWWSTRTPAGCG